MKTFGELTGEQKFNLCTAALNSKTIQRRSDGIWRDLETTTSLIFYRDHTYRIKPEPKTIWVNEDSEANVKL